MDGAVPDRILLGSIGANSVLRDHPLGADFSARLRDEPWPQGVVLQTLDWSPIAIAQDWQASAQRWDRVVLVGPADRGLEDGTVCIRRWVGGAMTVQAIQDRIYEAVTGVVALDNLLVIGAHFGIWPQQVVLVEVQVAEDRFGKVVAAEAAVAPTHVVGSAPPSAAVEGIMDETLAACRQAVAGDNAWLAQVPTRSVQQLNVVGEWYRHQVAAAAGMGRGR